MNKEFFPFADERFADLQMLRYALRGFEGLTLRQKMYIYCLSEATLYGRDITFDQQGKYNLDIRKVLEAVYVNYEGDRKAKDFVGLETYLKRVWFSSGIYHHYGCEKLEPGFDPDFLKTEIGKLHAGQLSLLQSESPESLCDRLFPVIFDLEVLPKRVNLADGDDLVLTSACNFYEGVDQKEVETFYAQKKNDVLRPGVPESEFPEQTNLGQPSWGLNSKLVKEHGSIKECTWKEHGMYGKAISKIIYWLDKSLQYAENDRQKEVINHLMAFYRSGDLTDFDTYSIAWVRQQDGMVDFINGFIEVYGDPLGLKGTWEGIVEYKDMEATKRTQCISSNAQWFEDHSPVDERFKKRVVTGVVAHVVCAAMLGGDEYPASAIGINLPNADWIRARYGSKSVTIGNLTEAYNQVAKGNGFLDEFVIDASTRYLIEKYGDICDELHTDLHDCLGHGSGQLLPDTDPDALKAYGSTIEEARADLFGLYYMADDKVLELGLVPDGEAYKSQYYSYLMNGLLTQLVRIKQGDKIEEAHMRNRALIARWTLAHADGAVELVCEQDDREPKGRKTYLKVNDYAKLRTLFGELLREIQRIKSEGDYEAARRLVEGYAIDIDADLHREILFRYAKLNIAPYKGFINPRLTLKRNERGEIVDVEVDYSEGYAHQMLRYSRDYGTL